MAILIAAVVGCVVGAAAAWWAQRRRAPVIEYGDRPAEPDPDADLALGLRTAVDQLHIGVVMCDAVGKIVYRNASAAEAAGTQGGVIVEDRLRGIFAEAQAGQPSSRVIELQGPPKVSLAIEAMPMADGRAVATIEDISERTRIDSMRTDFVTNISHELKTPVGAIAVLAEMLTDEVDPAVVSTLSARVVDESHRAAQTIDDLLALSQIESSRALDDVVSVNDVIDAAIGRGRMLAGDRRIDVSAILPSEPLHLACDRAQLTSALGNLVENAVKYSDVGDQVQVRTRLNDRWLEIMVADQGDGIPARDLDRVFERFYRVDKARARETGGTGLGLAIVRHVMSNHGGDVTVSSEEGEGSTFVLRFPARLIVAELDEPRGAATTPESTDSSDRTPHESGRTP